jgi:SAM-dependent methyltransferase
MSGQAHWDDRYENTPASKLSWYQERSPEVEFVDATVGKATPIIDIGGGLSSFVDELVDREFTNLSVLDISAFALSEGKRRVEGNQVEWICADIREWKPDRMYGLWHDRAAFHFLTDTQEQEHYWELVKDSLVPGGYLVLGCFSENGPDTCSGLPVARHSIADLESALGNDFEIIDTRIENHHTPNGGIQEFAWIYAQRM